MSFSSDIKKFSVNVDARGVRVFRGTAISLFKRIIKRTPVGNPENWVYFDKSN